MERYVVEPETIEKGWYITYIRDFITGERTVKSGRKEVDLEYRTKEESKFQSNGNALEGAISKIKKKVATAFNWNV